MLPLTTLLLVSVLPPIPPALISPPPRPASRREGGTCWVNWPLLLLRFLLRLGWQQERKVGSPTTKVTGREAEGSS